MARLIGLAFLPFARTSASADHPRTCGANHLGILIRLRRYGSSPHMRGKQDEQDAVGAGVRIIPAHAGQTGNGRGASRRPADHPRTCGANVVGVVVAMGCSGSSPHMRGKRTWRLLRQTLFRIIPAHAGQTDLASVAADAFSDHPRTCGANQRTVRALHDQTGSSPHMRGKLPRGLRARMSPADHPRTCGANGAWGNEAYLEQGSSPHMRGKPPTGPDPFARRRIIPAHAGQTRGELVVGALDADHPRTCGANSAEATR